MVTRGVIERAKGILMHSQGIPESQAFDLLNALSQRQKRKLRDVAAEIAAGVVDPRVAVIRPVAVPAPASPEAGTPSP